MNPDDDTTTLDAASEADFDSGFTGKPADKPAATEGKPAKTEAATAAPEGATVAAEETPEYVQVTRKEWDEIRAAAQKTASYDAQISKLFGKTGDLQRLLNEARSKPEAKVAAGRKIVIDPASFSEMSRDFPELADQTRRALEAALANVPIDGADAAGTDRAEKLQEMLAAHTAKREIETLEFDYPDWRTIVGAVDISREAPPADNAFRKWLAGKPAEYQTRVNASESAVVIGRAIRTFQKETAQAAAKPAAVKPRDDARAARIRDAVQPRGDNAGTPAGKSDDDAFLEGFNSR